MPRLSQSANDQASLVETAADLRERARKAAAHGRPAVAVRLLRMALRTLPPGVGLPVRVRVLCTLAYAEAEVSSVADGLTHLAEARVLLQSFDDSPERAELAGLVHSQHALVLMRARRIAEALPLYDQAIPLFERARAAGAIDPAVLVRAVLNRGRAHIDVGNIAAATTDMVRALELSRAHALDVLAAKSLSNLGDIAHLTGDIPGALDHHEQALRIFRDHAPDLVPRTQIDQARALLAAGLPREAAEHLDEALPALRRNRSAQDLAEAELARAASALLLGELDLARALAAAARTRFLRRGATAWAEVAALARMRADALLLLGGRSVRSASSGKAVALANRLEAIGLTDEAAMARLLAVQMAIFRGHVTQARDLVAAVPAPGPLTPIDHRMLLRLCRAELASSPQDALAEAREGLRELAQVRDRMGGLDLVCGTAVHGRELGDLAVGLVLSSGRAEEVFDWLERTRAQIYRYEPLPAIDDPLLAARVAESRSVARTLQQARLDGRPVGMLEAKFEALGREVARLGWHTSPWGRPRPTAGVNDVVAALGTSALVSFTVHGTSLMAVVMVDGAAQLITLGPAEPVAEVTRQLHADLDVLAPDRLPPPLVGAVTLSASRRAAVLDAAVVAPLLPLVGMRPLVIVPTGALYAMPWNSLPSLAGRPVVIAPSATAWLAASAAESHSSSVVLVRGPEVGAEVAGLAEAFPEAAVVDGAAATSSTVLSALDSAGLAHIAAHGEHAAENALFSRLELADGPLFAHEVARLGKVPERVVLAACSLALSHIRPGDEALGFAGALLASGSSTVVAAVNRVGEAAASAAMDRFYALVAKGEPMSAALATAVAEDPLRRPFVCLGAT